MKARQNIAYLLFVISLMLLVIPVIPHHHHADGHLCLKNDITADCCTCPHPQEQTTDHGCDPDCITTHFFEQIPGTNEEHMAAPEVPQMILLFSHSLSILPSTPETATKGWELPYRERLPDATPLRIGGLRAPPHCA